MTTRAILLLGVLVLLIASYATSVHAWWGQRQEILALEQQVARAEADIAELEDLEQRWKDPAFVRQQARERFGWVMPGEVGYRVIGLDGQLQGDLSNLEAPPTPPTQDWAARMWGSVERAGQPIDLNTEEDDADDVLMNRKTQ